jgi:ribose 5-phosphate isomerase B
MKPIVIGADHRGFEHKEYIKQQMNDITFLDIGAHNAERSDYPVFSRAACEAISAGTVQLGVLLCGNGVGMTIAANRYRGIYAALAWNDVVAMDSRMHDNANILVLPSDFVSPQYCVIMIRAWLSATFLGGRYQERVAMIDAQ